MTLSPPQTQTSLRVEPSQRWVRGFVNGLAAPLVDSKRVLVAYGIRRTPIYFFPRHDIRLDLLRPTRQADGVQHWSAEVDGQTTDDLAWSFLDTTGERAPLADHLAFDWPKLAAWFEEDEEVFVHPRDPHHRVDVLHSSRHVRVVVAGQVVADSHRPCLLFETGLPVRYYLPKMDVRMDLLEPTPTHSQCPYKGNAVYWSVNVGDRVYPDVVWSYPFTTPECPKIQNLLAFYAEKVDLYVDGELQPKAPPRH